MAKVLQNFLIGVGLDTEDYDKGAKNVESSLGRFRSLTTITGAAMVGAFAAVGSAAVAAGKRVDRDALAGEKFKTSTQYVIDYGNALKKLGGDASEAFTAIDKIEAAQADLNIEGLLGPLRGVALAGADIMALKETEDGKDFLRTIAPMVQAMNKDQQRKVQQELGFSDAVMRSLRDGLDQFDSAIERAHSLAGNFDDAVLASRAFNAELAEFDTRMEGIGNTLAAKVLPGFTDIVSSLNGFIDSNKGLIEKGADLIADNPMAASLIGAGAATAGTGLLMKGMGLRSAGLAATRLGMPGMIVGGGLLAADAFSQIGVSEGEEGTAKQRGAMTEYSAAPVDGFSKGNDSAADYIPPVEMQQRASDTYVPELKFDGINGMSEEKKNVFSPYINVDVPELTNRKPELNGLFDSKDLKQPEPKHQYQYVPIYSGGEIPNDDAASVTPEVIMLKDQRLKSEQSKNQPKINLKNELDINLEIGGRQFDTKVLDVINKREREQIDGSISSVDR